MKNDLLLQLDRLAYPVLILNESNEFIWSNNKFNILHKSALINKNNILIRDIVISSILPVLDRGEYEVQNIKKKHYFSIIESSIDLNGKTCKFLSFFDISKRKELTRELSEKGKMFESLSEYLPEGIVLYNEKIIYSNPAFEKLSGYRGRELMSKNFIELLLPKSQSELKIIMDGMLLKQGKKYELNAQIRRKKGDILHVQVKTQSLMIDNNIHFLSIISDITHKIKEHDRLKQFAYVDALTGIYNRRKFDELLEVEYSRAKRYKRNLSALFFDIDHFKKVNDNFGHDIGDDVLKMMAHLVKSNIRETDFFARWGGEEFIVLLPETSLEDALTIAEHIRSGIESKMFEIVGKITVSIGVSKIKEKERIETFIKRLDNALYKAKHEGRNKVVKL
ncbi:diguanylate cyclase [Candidatus Sulfurimonas marisnigri]|uniref:diguanylate cyclase n=1 Tax=Candidatus Sulfurimonas marisnigri TaxID=2740405 RepID=A0A7S7M338_9BACT|nr:sensor domain-containing diguanylate cyclase [Candidatus Sulfurimonas marisnigri]QOY55639.1 diguanylate cyclase [Candidatus Sulfurimonas marisnigri]